jgi:glycosyltransferase involved in cell wall biosynthesis
VGLYALVGMWSEVYSGASWSSGAVSARIMTHTVSSPVAHPPGSYRLSVVVPCYNEQDGVMELHRRVSAACHGVVGASYEVVLVDDGSNDRTWERIGDLVSSGANVVGVRLSRNHGHQLALSAGLTFARGERVLLIDADLQDPPELLPAMMKLMDDGADVVYGQRVARRRESAFKRATAAAFYRLLDSLTDVRIPVDTGDFRLMSRRALDVFLSMPEQHRFIRGMVSWIGFRQVPILYERRERFAGVTKYPFSKMLRLGLDAVTSFSTRPLRLASMLGAFFGMCGLGGLLYTLGSWVTGHVVPGWTSATSIMLVLGSTQLLVLGILGEYLGRLYVESKGRPLFVVQEVLAAKRPSNDPSE